jgi:hypothetical protein
MMRLTLSIAVVLGGAVTLLAQRPPQVAGVVRSATTGEAVQNAIVLLAPRGAASKLSRTTTGADGSFGFSGLASGVYQLLVRKAGYQVFEASAPVTILSEGADAVRLAPSLWPCGVISGRIVDWEGEPVAEAEVRAYALVYQASGATLSLAAKSESNDLGEYRLFDLPADKYVVQASPPRGATSSGQFYANTPAAYYPGAPRPAQALPIDLHWGEDIAQADVKIQQGQSYAIAGVVWDAPAEGPCTRCLVQAVQHDGPFRISLPQTARVSREGAFVLRGLSAGDYTLVVRQGSSKGTVAQTPATIRNRPVEDARLVVGVQQPVTGAIVLEKPPEGLDTAAWTLRLSPLALPEWWPGEDGRVDVDQSFTIAGVSPARYRFELDGLPRGAYLKALRLGGQPLRSTEITVSQQAPTSGLEPVVAFDGATVQGKVRSAENAAIPARVFLLPPPDHANFQPPSSTETAPDGSFNLGSVAPGAYILLAVPASATLQILDPAVQAALARYATTVRLDSNQTVNIEVPLAAPR